MVSSRFWRVSSGVLVVASGFLLSACSGSGGMRTASEAVSSVATEDPARARAKAHTELASQYYQNRNMAIALEEVAIAIEADGDYAPAYSVRALIQNFLKENDAADENFRKALRLAPTDPEINNNYGWFLCQIGREKESFRFFVTAVKNALYQTPEKSLINAGICAVKADDLKSAEEYYQKALALGRGGQQAYLPLAQLEYRKGELHESRHYLAEHHRVAVPTAESLWLGIRVERKLMNRSAETDLVAQLRRRFPDSKEARELRRGSFE